MVNAGLIATTSGKNTNTDSRATLYSETANVGTAVARLGTSISDTWSPREIKQDDVEMRFFDSSLTARSEPSEYNQSASSAITNLGTIVGEIYSTGTVTLGKLTTNLNNTG